MDKKHITLDFDVDFFDKISQAAKEKQIMKTQLIKLSIAEYLQRNA